MSDFPISLTQYGFKWGPMEVVRCASTPTWGVMADIVTPRQRLQIRVTPSGLIRVDGPYPNHEAAPQEPAP